MAQIEHLMLGVMAAELVRLDEDDADDMPVPIAGHPGFARPDTIAHQRVKRFLAFERIDEQRDFRRKTQQQLVNLAGIVEPRRAIVGSAHGLLRAVWPGRQRRADYSCLRAYPGRRRVGLADLFRPGCVRPLPRCDGIGAAALPAQAEKPLASPQPSPTGIGSRYAAGAPWPAPARRQREAAAKRSGARRRR